MTFEVPEFLKILGLPMLGVLLGTAARSQKWRIADDAKLPNGEPDPRAGRMNWRRAIAEWVSMPAIAMIVAGVGQMFHLDPIVTAGFGAAIGLVGAVTIGEIAERGLRQKVDGLTTGAK